MEHLELHFRDGDTDVPLERCEVIASGFSLFLLGCGMLQDSLDDALEPMLGLFLRVIRGLWLVKRDNHLVLLRYFNLGWCYRTFKTFGIECLWLTWLLLLDWLLLPCALIDGFLSLTRRFFLWLRWLFLWFFWFRRIWGVRHVFCWFFWRILQDLLRILWCVFLLLRMQK